MSEKRNPREAIIAGFDQVEKQLFAPTETWRMPRRKPKSKRPASPKDDSEKGAEDGKEK